MSTTIRNTTCLISILLFVYFMRQAELSPSGFLSHHVIRLTQQQKLSAEFCTANNDGLTFSEGEKSRAASYRNGLSDIRGDRTLTDYINRDEPLSTFGENYGKSYIRYLIPWAVFFVIGAVGCLVFLCNWCCMTCPCTKNRICSACRAPTTPRYRNCYVILSLLFMVFTIGAGAAGIYFTTKFHKYVGGTLCSAVKFIEETKEGSEEHNWIGVEPGITAIDTLVQQVRDAVAGLSVYDTLIAGYNQELNQISSNLTELNSNFSTSTLDRISPGAGTYQPYYIQELGTATNEFANMIDQGREMLQGSQAVLVQFRSEVQTETDSAINEVLDNRPTLVQVNDGLNDALKEISDNKSTITTIENVVFGVILGLFIGNTAVGVVAILSIVLVCCGAKFFNKSVHLSWCVLGLLMLVSWVLSAAFFGGTILVSEACNVVDGALNDPVFFNKTFVKVAHAFDVSNEDIEDTRDVLYTCIHGDGDLATQFDITSNLVVFNNIFSRVNELNAQTEQNVGQLPEGLNSEQIGLLGLFKTGYLPDSNETIGDLITMNLLTSSQFNPCTSVNDRWWLNSANCTEDQGTLFQADSPVDFDIPAATCIGYNQWDATERDIDNRYTASVFAGLACADINNDAAAIAYVNSLVANRVQSDTLIDNLEQAVNELGDQYIAFKSSLGTTTIALDRTNSTVNSIYVSLTQPNTGIIAQSNCKSIKESVWEVHDVACVGFGALAYQIMITFLILSFVTLFGTLFLFCLAKRFVVKSQRKDPKVLYVKE